MRFTKRIAVDLTEPQYAAIIKEWQKLNERLGDTEDPVTLAEFCRTILVRASADRISRRNRTIGTVQPPAAAAVKTAAPLHDCACQARRNAARVFSPTAGAREP